MARRALKLGFAAAGLLAALMPAARAEDTVKIAFIDPLSGAFADVGDYNLKHFQYMADRVNAAGGVAGGKKLEVIGFDNKTAPAEAVTQFQKAVDQGIRYITQGNGSSVANALVEAVEKHNARNPEARVVYLNYAAVDPALTNEKCSFWHFRFDADADMKMDALTDWLKTQGEIKKLYILGQDYSFGKAVAAAAVKQLAVKRPDLEIVGNELHPLGKVKDFSPYIAKMKSAGAQAVITGNWGTDMSLLIKASDDAGFSVPYLTYYGGLIGAPTAMGKAGVGRVKQIANFHMNAEAEGIGALNEDFAKKTGADFYTYTVKTAVEMLARAMNETASTDVFKVASALEGMALKTELGTATMRKDNHQLLQTMIVSTFSEGVKYPAEKTPYGFKTDLRIEADKTAMPTVCKMARPEK
jgi:branched-chain amino acid transport system substrate-binding protein